MADHGDADSEDTTHDHHDDHDHGHGHDRPDYDPENVDLPSRAPPLRSTAPQSDYTTSQVLQGAAVALVGILVVFGLPILLV